MCIKVLLAAVSAVLSLLALEIATKQGLVVSDGFPLRQHFTPPSSPLPSYNQPIADDSLIAFYADKPLNNSNLTPSQPLLENLVPKPPGEAHEKPVFESALPSPRWKAIIFRIVYTFLHLENRLYWTLERLVWLFFVAFTKFESNSCQARLLRVTEASKSDQEMLREENAELQAIVRQLNDIHQRQLDDAASTAAMHEGLVVKFTERIQEADEHIGRLNQIIDDHRAREQETRKIGEEQVARINELSNEIRTAKHEIDCLNQFVTDSQARQKEACKIADRQKLENELLRGELNETRQMVLNFEAKNPVVTPAEAEANAALEELEGMRLALAESRMEMQKVRAEFNRQGPLPQDPNISVLEQVEAKSRTLTIKEQEIDTAAIKVAARQEELEKGGIMRQAAPVPGEERDFRVNTYKLAFQNTLLKEAKVSLVEAERELRAVNDGLIKRTEHLGIDNLYYKDAIDNHYRRALQKAGLPMPKRPFGSDNPFLFPEIHRAGHQAYQPHRPNPPAAPRQHQQQQLPFQTSTPPYHQPQPQPHPQPSRLPPPQPFSHQLPSLPQPPPAPRQPQQQLKPQAAEFVPRPPRQDANNPGRWRKDW